MIRGNLLHRRQTSAIVILAGLLTLFAGAASSYWLPAERNSLRPLRLKLPLLLRLHCAMPRPSLTAIG